MKFGWLRLRRSSIRKDSLLTVSNVEESATEPDGQVTMSDIDARLQEIDIPGRQRVESTGWRRPGLAVPFARYCEANLTQPFQLARKFMTTFLALDTCVWINVAARPALWEALAHLEAVVGSGAAKLVVPAIVRTELGRHLPGTPERASKSIITQVQNAKVASAWLADQTAAAKAAGALDEILSHLSGGGQQVQDMTSRILALLDAESSIQMDTTTASMKGAALDRALVKRAPCHNSKNNVADALIVEACRSFAQDMKKGDSLVIASDNTKEFADPKDQRVFHPDLQADFGGFAVTYSTNVAETIGSIDSAQVDESLVARYENLVADRSPTCTNCNVEMYGHWRNSQFGGGLSWHFTCPKCRQEFDTGDYYD